MSPESHQNQQVAPATLPALSGMGVQAPTGAAMQQPVPAVTQDGAALTAQARQLIAQYAHDPHKLSSALTQLRMSHLAQNYHINASGADN
ncbi:MAG TPA: hypothetical protein VGM08_03100 [Candidatus Saccharimonadales bacterium]|jgi:hypothetical protein